MRDLDFVGCPQSVFYFIFFAFNRALVTTCVELHFSFFLASLLALLRIADKSVALFYDCSLVFAKTSIDERDLGAMRALLPTPLPPFPALLVSRTNASHHGVQVTESRWLSGKLDVKTIAKSVAGVLSASVLQVRFQSARAIFVSHQRLTSLPCLLSSCAVCRDESQIAVSRWIADLRVGSHKLRRLKQYRHESGA